jgi:hypothetical protein
LVPFLTESYTNRPISPVPLPRLRFCFVHEGSLKHFSSLPSTFYCNEARWFWRPQPD